MSSPSTTDIPATSNTAPEATARPWREALRREPERYAACSPEAISHGSQAQMKYFVADAQHDIAILATRLAEVERELVRERQTSRGDWSSQRDNDALIIDLDEMKTRALAAEARIAEIRSLLVELIGGFPMSEVLRHAAGKSKHFIVCHPDGQRIYAIRSEDVLKAAALAAEQKEAGK